MAFMHQHGSLHQYSAHSATLHFLDELASAGHDVQCEWANLLACDPHVALPAHLHLNAVVLRMLANYLEHPPVALAVTRQGSHSHNTKTSNPECNPFKQPALDVTCDACGHHGHLPTSCVFLVRFALLMQYYSDHKDQASKLATILTE